MKAKQENHVNHESGKQGRSLKINRTPRNRGGQQKEIVKSRAAQTNIPSRFEKKVVDESSEYAQLVEEQLCGERLDKPEFIVRSGDHLTPMSIKATEYRFDHNRSLVSRNQSPDVPFTYSINPYQGCEHGCIYCFARPTHGYWDLSPGLDFERVIFVKKNVAEPLNRFLSNPDYQCEPIALGANTDPYQPAEKQYKLTRQILTVMLERNHPVTIVTKSSLIERDLDLLSQLAAKNLVKVMISVTTLDVELKNIMEPRASSPTQRLKTIRRLTEANIPVGVLFAPVIPFVNDHEMEAVIEAVSKAGASHAGFVVLRLPNELKEIVVQWLQTHFPDRWQRVINRIRDMRGGKLYQSDFGQRMLGEGVYTELFRKRFQVACRKFNIGCERRVGEGTPLDTSQFRKQYEQFSLFG